jgi:diaminopimelate decarboxylase
MNDFIRPALYGAFHRILPERRSNRPVSRQDVVGPVCESADFFAKDRELQTFVPGELLAIDEAGAYGFSMSSNYNSRPRAAEILVDGEKMVVIRKRESHQDLIKGEM